MTATLTVADVCDGLFDDYRPYAVAATSTGSEMVLMEPAGGGARFWDLSFDDESLEYGLRRHGRPYTDRHRIRRGGAVSDLAADVLAGSRPVPVHGSVFVWAPPDAEFAEAAIVVYTAYDAREAPEPTWLVMPRADLDQWPSFAAESVPGLWFWPHVAAELVVSLNEQIPASPGTFWWTSAGDASPVLAVRHEVVTAPGLAVAASSVFACCDTIRAGTWIPGLEDVATDPGAIDLALAGS